jgi:DNA/RNA-binding domain of Phe-tRNA-synthetase-like protein
VTVEGLDLREGWVDPELAAEFPELGLTWTVLEARPRRTPAAVRERLRALSDRFTGGHVVHMRQDPVPWAYRVFSRQVGIDPDTDRTPVERAALERLTHGAFQSRNLVDDALTIAVVETGVPVIALDGDRMGAVLGLRLAQPEELLGGSARPLSDRQIVVADEERSLAVVFGEVAEGQGVTPGTARMVLAAVRVQGVPRISVEEALWTAAGTLLEG